MKPVPDSQDPRFGLAHDDEAGGTTPATSRRHWLRQAGVAAAAPWLASLAHTAPTAGKRPTALILAYSRFADTAEDAQTVRRATLAGHFKALRDTKAGVISMVDLVAHHVGRMANLPPRPVVISVDDGDRSVVDILMKQMQGSAWPVTLFVTPSTVGKSPRALSWDALSGLHHSGRFSVQSRTLSGADLVQARQGRSAEAFAQYALGEIQRGKETVENRLVKPVSFQAWPGGAFDAELMDIATDLGFHASLALGDKPASLADPIQGLSRIVMHDGISGRQLAQLIQDTYKA